MEYCPLCNNAGELFYKEIFYSCKVCSGIFRSKEYYPTPGKEKARYEMHENHIHNEGYLLFVSPLILSIFESFMPVHKGLDFGAGPGPVISEILKDRGYDIKMYDPYFHNFPILLEKSYNYIVCCEVMEHFQNPEKEFMLLYDMLEPKGILYCMTHIYNANIDFNKWYYKNDFTHIFIYQVQTLEWIKTNFGFRDLNINNRLIRFVK
jgi:SAM-dependent methyltransferase